MLIALSESKGTVGCEGAPTPKILGKFFSFRCSCGRLFFKVGASSQEDKLGSDHEKRLEDKCSFEVLEGVEVESKDIGDEKNEADVNGEASY